jgi:hypothetical protein
MFILAFALSRTLWLKRAFCCFATGGADVVFSA